MFKHYAIMFLYFVCCKETSCFVIAQDFTVKKLDFGNSSFSQAYFQEKYPYLSDYSTQKNISYHICSSDLECYEGDVNDLKEVDPSKKIAFVIHGWSSGPQKRSILKVKSALEKYNFQVILVDWSHYAKIKVYWNSANKAPAVGHEVSQALMYLFAHKKVPLNNILLVGFSLGAHISGFAAKSFHEMSEHNLKIKRIVALDPAKLYKIGATNFTKRLDSSDAEVVQVIHTDGGKFGYKDPLGTIDFYPHGGHNQPRCQSISKLVEKWFTKAGVSCSHRIAIDYFVDAILNPQSYLATKCDSWEAFKNETCGEPLELESMGNLETNKTGLFYLFNDL